MKNKKFIKAYLLRLFTKKNQSTFRVTDSKKVLILKYDRIGDMIVTTPIFRELKKSYPDISISVLASNLNKDVIKYNPYVEKIYTNYKNNLLFDFGKLLILRWKRFDVCIELEHSVIPHAIFRLKRYLEYITDKKGETILAKFYKDQDKYSFSFQMMAYISRISLLRKIIKKNPTAIIITERSVLTDKNVFAKCYMMIKR